MVWHFLDTIDIFGKKEKKINWLTEILPYFFGFLVCKPIHCFYTERMLQKEMKLYTALYLHKFWFLPTNEEGVTGVLICAAYMNIQQTDQPQTQLCILKFLKTALVLFAKLVSACLIAHPSTLLQASTKIKQIKSAAWELFSAGWGIWANANNFSFPQQGVKCTWVFGSCVCQNPISLFLSTWPDLPNQPTLHMFCVVNVSERLLKCPFHSFWA